MSDKQVKNICGLSPIQEGMYFHYLMNKVNDPYVIQSQYELNGHVDLVRLKETFHVLTERHDCLRTLFMHQKTPDPVQIILKSRETPFVFHDLTGSKDPDEYIHTYLKEDRNKGFDLSRDPLLRIALFKVEEQTFRMVMTLHHIIMDGWSSGIIERELFMIYAGGSFRDEIMKSSPNSFADYIKWLKTQSTAQGIEFFKQKMGAISQFAPFTNGRKKLLGFEEEVYSLIERISGPDTLRIKTLASDLRVTTADLLRTIWSFTVARFTGEKAFTTLHTVSGRPAEMHRSSDMVGMFINAIVQPFLIEDRSIRDVVRHQHELFAESMQWQHLSLSQVAKSLSVSGELSDHLIVMENYPDLGEERSLLEREMGFSFKPLKSEESTNYPVTVQFHVGNTIETRFFMKKCWFTEAEILELKTTFDTVLTEVLKDVFNSVKWITKTGKTTSASTLAKDPVKLFISSNFTDTNLIPYLKWWTDRAGFDASITLADYNTVHQQLSDLQSALFSHPGPKVIMINLSDLARFKSELDGQQLESFLKDALGTMIEPLSRYRGSDPIFFVLTPDNGRADRISEVNLKRIGDEFIASLSDQKAIKIIDLRIVPIGSNDLFDPVTDQMGHVPYTEAGYAYLASQLARNLRAWKHQPFKVIALDADNTLWQGVLGEDGVHGIQITQAHRYLQEFMLKKKGEGFLLTLCTKNNATDVDELFAVRDDMVLKHADFVSIAANWGAKSTNLTALAAELNLGIDSFIFLDDSELEIREVIESQPDVLALQLPEDLNQWKSFLDRIWAFDTYLITEEDRQRTSMYQAEKKRREITESKENNANFVAQLEVRTTFHRLSADTMDRMEQLTQRTNQFNLNGRRFTKSEITRYASTPDHFVYSMSVSDKFGDYGITGALFIKIEGVKIVVDAWMLSCRVLARGVEYHVLRHLCDIASSNAAEKLRFHHRKTEKNIPIQQFLSTDGFVHTQLADTEHISVEIPAQHIPKLPEIGSYEVIQDFKIPERSARAVTDTPKRSLPQSYDVPHVGESNIAYWVYGKVTEAENHPRNSRYVAELTRLRPDLLEESRIHSDSGFRVSIPYQEPLTQTEIRMAAIWKTLLDTDRIGRKHDFFLSGGNSLMATRLASRIYQEFKMEIELGSIFKTPVLSDFCTELDQRSITSRTKITPLETVELEFYPLSPSQERIWRSEQLFESQAGYVLGGMYKILGKFDVKRLQRALKSLTKSHASLRTCFPVIDGVPRQVIKNEIEIDIQKLIELGDISDPDSLNDLFFGKKLDLVNGPLVEIGYAEMSQTEHLLAIKIHHLITDGWSQGILMHDLMHYYTTDEDPEIRTDARFVDFVQWSAIQVREQLDTVSSFWNQELAGELERVTLPYDYIRPGVLKKSPRQFRIDLDKRLMDAVNSFSRKNQLSLYMTMMAGVQLLIQTYTGKRDILIGSPFSGRTHPDVHQTVGFFVNTLPFRLKSDPDTDLKSWLNEIRTKTIKLLEFQHVPLDTIIRDLNISHDQRPPLFDVLLLVQERTFEEHSIPDFEIESVGSEHLGAGYDVVFQVFDSPDGWELAIEYQPELYHERFISMVAEHWKAILLNLTKTPVNQRISQVDSLDNSLRDKLIQLGSGAKKEYRRQTLIDVFKETVQAYPSNTALITEAHASITYFDLDQRTDQLALRLISVGIEPGDNVVVHLGQKSDVIEWMIAILKCRAVYVPVDMETPLTRCAYIADSCKPKLWISDSSEPFLENPLSVSIRSIKELLEIQSIVDTRVLPAAASPDEMAYMIFTSGSTGRPKGVAVHHQGIINMTHSHVRNCDVQDNDRVLCFASISFDASLSEFFMAILPGACMVCPPAKVKKDAIEFVQFMNDLKITVTTLPPVFLASLNQPELPYLKSIVTAGEAARKSDALYFAKTKRYINAYGPTECSVGTNAHIVHVHAEYPNGIPIGRAYDNVQLVVLDESLNLAPFGASGQLAVNGVQVAMGYVNNPELTSRAFIDHPLFPGKTYLTGDQVKWNFNGELEFIGRNDSQVKIRGYRIELDEIKHQLDRIESIQISYIQAQKDNTGEKQLVAYLVEKESLSDHEIREHLAKTLPVYMIPGFFVRVDDIKLTINGKVDVNALPDPFNKTHELDPNIDTSSQSRAQQAFIETLSRFLPAFPVDLTRTFLQIGGDSIKAIQVAHHLQQQGYAIKAGKIYEHHTLSELIGMLELTERAELSRPEILTGYVDCTPMQEKFFNEVLDPAQRNLFWMQAGFRIDQFIPTEIMEEILSEITGYHEIFRMRFAGLDSRARVEVTQEPKIQLVVLNKDSTSFESELNKYTDQLKKYIHIESGQMTSFLVVQSPYETHITATFHHLIIDAISLRVLRDQFQWLTIQFLDQKELKLDGKYITQREWINEIKKLQLPDINSDPWKDLFLSSEIRCDRNEPISSSICLDEKLTYRFTNGCSIRKEAIDSVILAISLKAIATCLNLPSLRVGIESQGRNAGNNHIDIGSTLGWFTLEYPIRLSSHKDISEILSEIKEQKQEVTRDGLTAVLAENSLRRGGKQVFAPELGYNFLGEFEPDSVESGAWNWDSSYLPDITYFNHQWHPIEVSALIEQGELKIRIQSNTSRMNPAQIEEALAAIHDEIVVWLDRESDTTLQKPALICFPFVASNARFFDTIKAELSDEYQVITLELPGHGARIDETPVNTLEAACTDLIRQLNTHRYLSDTYIWLGHSMGAYVALTLAARLENDPVLRPSGVVFSDVAAPGQFEKWIVGDLSEDQKTEYYRRLGYDKIMESLDEMSSNHFEAMISADLGIVRPFVNTDQPIITIPSRFLYSKQDSIEVKDHWTQGWQQFCSEAILSFGFDGGHIDWLQNKSSADLLKTVIQSFISRG